ncbi:MAG: LON peptidase substrate-binding domain-containing protein [Deltaproteobacteria bacterium]
MRSFNIDLRDAANLENFSGLVPLFPLATVVFFPNTLLPLHVFEARYRQMVRDAMQAERIVGMILLKPGWEKGYQGNPEIFSVGCMGRIVSHEELPDGRFNIVLFGLKRVKILEIIKETPYRLARVEIMEDIRGSNENLYSLHIAETISRWNSMLGKSEESHKITLDPRLALQNITDAYASAIVSNTFEKQELLEEPSVEKRAEKIIANLETRIKIVSMTSERRSQIVDKKNLN